MSHSLPQNKSTSISILRNLSKEEIPDNLQELKILRASQIINGTLIKVNPKKVIVTQPGEHIYVNLETSSKK
ncbi:MAG: hypothetical protein N4A62_17145 [Marinisporobacter sp.]|jgi:hypothetical protein|nr:hypothetical protein [Marinisporobacter sp.]